MPYVFLPHSCLELFNPHVITALAYTVYCAVICSSAHFFIDQRKPEYFTLKKHNAIDTKNDGTSDTSVVMWMK